MISDLTPPEALEQQSHQDSADSEVPSARKRTTQKKYLKTKELFVANNEIGFPEMAADFVIANLECINKQWSLLIQEGISYVESLVWSYSGLAKPVKS